MRVLIDSHALIWAVDEPSRLGPIAASTIRDPAIDRLVSVATIWEIAIKAGLKKLALTLPYRQWVEKSLDDLSAELLPIEVAHAEALASLPAHHRDPFDRMMIAQALVEGTPVVTVDSSFDAYGISRLW